jgi:outer membrane receptor protein involved in Fe transport
MSLAWEPDARNRVEAAVYAGSRYQSRVADLDYDNLRIDAAGGTRRFRYYNENTQDKDGVFTLASLGSSHKLGNSSTLLLSGQYEGADLEGRTTNRNLAAKGSPTDYQTTVNPSRNPLHAYRVKADVISRRGSRTWQGGYQFRHDDQRGDFAYDYRDLGQAVFMRDAAFSGTLRVSNHIHAAYAQASGEAGAIAWQSGLRAEHLHRSLESSVAPREELRMLNLFPSVVLRYRTGEGSTIRSSFTRRIRRSSNFELNPIPEREHSETLEQGDPRLLPERTGSWEAGWERRLTRGSLALSAYHQRIRNPVQRVNGVFNDTILDRIYTNADKALQTGLEANLDLRPGKVWQLLLGANIYRFDIRGAVPDKPGIRSNGSWVMNLNTTQTVTFKGAWSAQFTLNWLTRRATVQGIDGPFITPSLTVRKSTGDGRWTFLGQWLYMDAGLGISNRQRISTYGPEFRTTTLYIYEPDQVQFSASFNLRRKNRNPALPQSEMAEKEF